jgi:hypothetical protein
MDYICDWCSYEYPVFNKDMEREHLQICKVFQSLPVAQFVNGKTFVALPDDPNILVERVRIN